MALIITRIIFMGMKAIFSTTAFKRASKSIKNVVEKVYFLHFFTGLPPIRGYLSPLEFSVFNFQEFKPIHIRTISKNRTAISSKLNFLEI
jgi:hypothetical protein